MDPETMKYKLAIEYSAKSGAIVHHNRINYPGSCDHFTYKQLVEKQGSKYGSYWIIIKGMMP